MMEDVVGRMAQMEGVIHPDSDVATARTTWDLATNVNDNSWA